MALFCALILDLETEKHHARRVNFVAAIVLLLPSNVFPSKVISRSRRIGENTGASSRATFLISLGANLRDILREKERAKARSENVTVIYKKSRPTRCTKNSRSEISVPRRLARTYFFARQRDAGESISDLRFFSTHLCPFL